MDRGCIYPFLFHIESFLGTRAANMWLLYGVIRTLNLFNTFDPCL